MRKFKKVVRWIIMIPLSIVFMPVTFLLWINEDSEQGYISFIREIYLK